MSRTITNREAYELTCRAMAEVGGDTSRVNLFTATADDPFVEFGGGFGFASFGGVPSGPDAEAFDKASRLVRRHLGHRERTCSFECWQVSGWDPCPHVAAEVSA